MNALLYKNGIFAYTCANALIDASDLLVRVDTSESSHVTVLHFSFPVLTFPLCAILLVCFLKVSE